MTDECSIMLHSRFCYCTGSEEERNSVMMAHKTARFPKKGTYDVKEKIQVNNNEPLSVDKQLDNDTVFALMTLTRCVLSIFNVAKNDY